MNTETNWEKLKRKCKQDPFVPIGAVVTAGILAGGFHSFCRGEVAKSQKFMRARVFAQGATVVAIIIGSLYPDFKRKQALAAESAVAATAGKAATS